MSSFGESMKAYEDVLRARLGGDLVAGDLDEKHAKMADGPFPFLRATYWRWAETILDLCPELAKAPAVLSIGDSHIENFGTWRDGEGRLIWGANDFDEAAAMPYPLDLLRLAVSAILTQGGGGAADICDALETGYRKGIADPQPIVLEQDRRWLREAVMLPEEERDKFWKKLDKPSQPVSPRFQAALRAALPAEAAAIRHFPRSAGAGSLGRPRVVAIAEWRGGPVVREAKAVVPSAWSLAHAPGDDMIRAAIIAGGRYRAPDPHYAATDGIVVRRLSPNSRKIDAEHPAGLLLSHDMLKLMGREIANCHAGDEERLTAVREDLARRGDGWLVKATPAPIAALIREQDDFARTYRRLVHPGAAS